MIKLSLQYEWAPLPGKGTVLDAMLFRVLRAIHETGSIAAAARRVDMSYRYVWGLTGKWERHLGKPLVVLQQGRGAQLTAFGEKLLWAQRLVSARLTPDLESVRQEIERALSEGTEAVDERLAVCASHDLALAQLRDGLAQRPGLKLDVRFQGSLESLGALARDQCVLAGFHIADGLEDAAVTLFRELLDAREHVVVGFATRTQGLMFAQGNPKAIASLADLTRPGVRFVNRQRGSGSRVELDQLLSGAGIDAAAIAGYQNEEFTHLAIAATIAGGRADAGYGIKAAAAEYSLDYLSLLTERYYFACRRETLDSAPGQDFLAALRGAEMREILGRLPGYGNGITGQVHAIGDALPPPRAPRAAPRSAGHGAKAR
ncbi:MAG: substrate-binding domain-containing protein [Burkholderiales bacterium]